MKKRYGFDLDDVILNFMESFRGFHNENYGTNHELEDYTDFYLENILGCTKEEIVKRVEVFYNSHEHKNANPVKGAVEVLKKLSDKYELIIITAKPEELREQTIAWLNIHLPNIFSDVVFTNHFQGEGPKRNKGDVCLELGIEAFVDDAIHNAENVASVGIPVLLLDTPWNRKFEETEFVKRVQNWEQIEQILL